MILYPLFWLYVSANTFRLLIRHLNKFTKHCWCHDWILFLAFNNMVPTDLHSESTIMLILVKSAFTEDCRYKKRFTEEEIVDILIEVEVRVTFKELRYKNSSSIAYYWTSRSKLGGNEEGIWSPQEVAGRADGLDKQALEAALQKSTNDTGTTGAREGCASVDIRLWASYCAIRTPRTLQYEIRLNSKTKALRTRIIEKVQASAG